MQITNRLCRVGQSASATQSTVSLLVALRRTVLGGLQLLLGHVRVRLVGVATCRYMYSRQIVSVRLRSFQAKQTGTERRNALTSLSTESRSTGREETKQTISTRTCGLRHARAPLVAAKVASLQFAVQQIMCEQSEGERDHWLRSHIIMDF